MDAPEFQRKVEALNQRYQASCLKRDRLANSHAKAAAKAKFLFDRIGRLHVRAFIAATGIRVKALVQWYESIHRVESIEWDGNQVFVWIRNRDNHELYKVTDASQLKRFQKPAPAEVPENVAV